MVLDGGEDVLAGEGEVLGEEVGGQFGLAREAGLHHALVLGDVIAVRRAHAQRQVPVAGRKIEQEAPEPVQDRGLTGGHQRVVKGDVRILPDGAVGLLQLGEPIEGRDDVGLPFVVAARDRLGHRQALELCAQPDDLLELGDRHRRHREAAMIGGCHEALRAQLE